MAAQMMMIAIYSDYLIVQPVLQVNITTSISMTSQKITQLSLYLADKYDNLRQLSDFLACDRDAGGNIDLLYRLYYKLQWFSNHNYLLIDIVQVQSLTKDSDVCKIKIVFNYLWQDNFFFLNQTKLPEVSKPKCTKGPLCFDNILCRSTWTEKIFMPLRSGI